MTDVDEVIQFSRIYINYPAERTEGRKKKIESVYRSLTGQSIRASCQTCYIEAIFKIINLKKMANSRYQLKAGVLLQAFSDESKVCTNANITDELAEWHLKNNPDCAKYFAVMPGEFIPSEGKSTLPPVPAGITIIVPAEEPAETLTAKQEMRKTLSDIINPASPESSAELTKEPEVKKPKPERKKPVRSKAKK